MTTTYDYDDADQLTLESIAATWKQEYAYDANGNRSSFKKYDWVSGAWHQLVNDTYTYGVGDRLTAAGDKTFTYDACGRMKTVTVAGDLEKTYHYDYQDRLITTQYPDGGGTSDTYTYNIFNQRTRLNLNGTQWLFRRDGNSATASVLADYVVGGVTNLYNPGISQKVSGILQQTLAALKRVLLFFGAFLGIIGALFWWNCSDEADVWDVYVENTKEVNLRLVAEGHSTTVCPHRSQIQWDPAYRPERPPFQAFLPDGTEVKGEIVARQSPDLFHDPWIKVRY